MWAALFSLCVNASQIQRQSARAAARLRGPLIYGINCPVYPNTPRPFLEAKGGGREVREGLNFPYGVRVLLSWIF